MRLRTRENKSVYHAPFLRSGFYLGSSLVICAYGSWQAINKLKSKGDPGVKTAYLLQVCIPPFVEPILTILLPIFYLTILK